MKTLKLHQCSKLQLGVSLPPARASRPLPARRAAALAICSSEQQPGQRAALYRDLGVAMAASGAVLGPLCDGQHSAHDTLHYTWPQHVPLPTGQMLETAWWVPLLFALAAVILGTAHPLLHELVEPERPAPGWGTVLVGISFFVCQYAASGALEEPLLGRSMLSVPALDAVLAASAALLWAAVDGSWQGLGMAAFTALGGPAIEAGLTNGLHLYQYTHPAAFGLPSWIAWVYFCGSPAVGNLGRRCLQDLKCRRRRTET